MPRRKPPQMIALTQIFTMNKLNTPHTTIQQYFLFCMVNHVSYFTVGLRKYIQQCPVR